jgi:hypothetical protein
MPAVPTDIPPQARRGLRQIGLDEALENLVLASDALVESEQAFREQGRMRAVQADTARSDAAKRKEERLNQEGRRQLKAASSQFDNGTCQAG